MSKYPFSHLIIGKAMQTHFALGPGLVEDFFRQDLVNILRQGAARLRCILVDSVGPALITALGENVSATDRAVTQSCLRWLQLPWGIAAHFGHRCIEVRIILAPQSNQTL
jgi:hypothetical protein